MKSKVSLIIFGVCFGVLSSLFVNKFGNGNFQLISDAKAAVSPCAWIYGTTPGGVSEAVNDHYKRGFRSPSITVSSDRTGYVIIMCK